MAHTAHGYNIQRPKTEMEPTRRTDYKNSIDDGENEVGKNRNEIEIANPSRTRKTKREQILWQRSKTEQEKKVNRSVTNVSHICLLKSLAAKRSFRFVQHTFACASVFSGRSTLLVNDSADNPKFLVIANRTRSSATQNVRFEPFATDFT